MVQSIMSPHRESRSHASLRVEVKSNVAYICVSGLPYGRPGKISLHYDSFSRSALRKG